MLKETRKTDQEQPETKLKTVEKTQCAKCKKYFTRAGIFDTHRIGDYPEPIYAEGDTARKKPIGETPSTRRCMSTEEMIAAGLRSEKRLVIDYHEGQPYQEIHDVWFDAPSRERVRERRANGLIG